MTAITFTALPSWWTQWGSLIQLYSQEYGIDPALVASVLQQESGGNPNAQSTFKNPDGSIGHANGLMQVVGGSFDPATNLQQGISYLATQLTTFGGNVSLALAAYNAGPGAVQQYGGIPPYQETITYVGNIVGGIWPSLQQLIDGKVSSSGLYPGYTAPVAPSPGPTGPGAIPSPAPATAPIQAQAPAKSTVPVVGPVIDALNYAGASLQAAVLVGERFLWILLGLILVALGIYILVNGQSQPARSGLPVPLVP